VSRLLDHIAAVSPPDHLVVVGVRFLSPTAKNGRHLGHFHWIAPASIVRLPAWWQQQQTTQLLEDWAWIHEVVGGPDAAIRGRHIHLLHPGVPMVRLVTARTRPEVAGRLQELSSAHGIMVDVDIAERRPGDRRRYCPTVLHGLEFLAAYKPSVIIDGGGGLIAAWLFAEPAEPTATKHLAADVITDVGLGTDRKGWEFDSPVFGGQWLKVPGCYDHFRRVEVCELSGGPVWEFEQLRSIVPRYPRRASRRWIYIGGRAVRV
jgi:hypothetical protein